MSVTQQFTAGYRNMSKFFIKVGKRKIDSPSIRGRWMKPISKLRESGTIYINRLIPMG
jgi:putative transposase